MARAVPEWIGNTDDSAIPAAVWKRVLDRNGWCCARCLKPHTLVKSFHKDHAVALVNWTGSPPHGNRESNIQPLCESCHSLKTRKDVALKALASRHKEMRPGYEREKKRSRFAETRERLKLKYNWAKRRYEREREE